MDIQKKRAGKVLLILGSLTGAGLVFAYGATHWGWWLPCVFNQITGLKCPGCGVSRMCLAILRFDFSRAFSWNPAVFICLPFLAYLLAYLCVRYIRYGDLTMRRWQQTGCWIMVALLLIFGVFRNL
ncbi:DUF2752 domain-containing protein [Anaerovorax odorimutans]|uniref:DUF2752 domain-containing protein n=2 Tax=Anaerovorax odorimutans TaxID=109327 RepID=A0ABT1RLA0_9FIRM|nr:DUF2752 domain-containing protein [Anaerovorax odorimutans]